VSLSVPVTVQVREYIDPTIGVATLPVRATLTVMVGSGDVRGDTRTSIKLHCYNQFTPVA
jgi:hypothetical protein